MALILFNYFNNQTGSAAYADSPIPTWLVDPPRQAIWKFSLEASSDSRWFGIGANVIDKLPDARNWNEVTKTRNIPLHPHNWIVEILVETGIVGLFLMIATIGYYSLNLARNYLRTGDTAFMAALCVWATYWVISLFSVSYWSSWLQITFLIATAICLSGRKDPAKP
jgi:O-antigen ligase